MARITLADLTSQEVELPGGHVYTIAPANRALLTESKVIEARLDTLVEGDFDGIVGVYADLLSLRLDSAEKGQPHAGTVIKRLFETNKVTIPQIERLMDSISATDRPT